ncbi:MAG: hypothetical protein OXE87_14570 [Chloroflexi bacterium]|nr:hypothetical protein [Chloroflexota bacterium]
MSPIVIKISIEGDPDGTVDALRRIASMSDPNLLHLASTTSLLETDWEDDGDSHVEWSSLQPGETPVVYRPMVGNHGSTMAYRQALPEPAWPAQWDSRLGNELVRNMSENARRLVSILAAAGAEGMTRDAITSQLGIETDTIRTTQVSIGHALRRIQRANGNISLPRPVEFHKRLDTYMLNPAFRAALQGD